MYFLPSASFLSSYYWDQQPTRLPHPWDSPGKNTGVGCHFLLQCIKVKNESEVAQSCPTLSDPMDCSLPGSPVHGISQMRILEWVAIFFLQGISLPNSGIKPETSALQMDSLPLSHQGKIDTLYQEFHNRESNTKILSKELSGSLWSLSRKLCDFLQALLTLLMMYWCIFNSKTWSHLTLEWLMES